VKMMKVKGTRSVGREKIKYRYALIIASILSICSINICNGFVIKPTSYKRTVLLSKDGKSTTTTTTESQTIVRKVDEIGQKLKPKAMIARDTAVLNSEDWKKNAWYTFKACSFLSLFIAYRAYRGLFVVLPEVFKEVSRKLENAVDSPFNDDTSNDGNDGNVGKMRKRGRVTVFVLAAVLTSIYTLSGAYKVFTKFICTVFETSKVEPAFEAAADQIEQNEGNILKATTTHHDPNGYQ